MARTMPDRRPRGGLRATALRSTVPLENTILPSTSVLCRVKAKGPNGERVQSRARRRHDAISVVVFRVPSSPSMHPSAVDVLAPIQLP
jgi:hypothetical protein